MKKIWLIFGIFFALIPNLCFAEDEVYLELDMRERHMYDGGGYEYENSSIKSDEEEENYLKPSFGMFKEMFREDFAKDNSNDKSKRKKSK